VDAELHQPPIYALIREHYRVNGPVSERKGWEIIGLFTVKERAERAAAESMAVDVNACGELTAHQRDEINEILKTGDFDAAHLLWANWHRTRERTFVCGSTQYKIEEHYAQ
jgi:hypothetical protein